LRSAQVVLVKIQLWKAQKYAFKNCGATICIFTKMQVTGHRDSEPI